MKIEALTCRPRQAHFYIPYDNAFQADAIVGFLRDEWENKYAHTQGGLIWLDNHDHPSVAEPGDVIILTPEGDLISIPQSKFSREYEIVPATAADEDCGCDAESTEPTANESPLPRDGIAAEIDRFVLDTNDHIRVIRKGTPWTISNLELGELERLVKAANLGIGWL